MAERLAIHGGKPVRSKPFPSWPVFGKKEERGLIRVLRSGKWGRLDGEEVARFEVRFAEYHGAKHGIAVVNGTAALRVALLAAGIQSGEEVIVPPYTFLATASAVVECNAVPVFVDIDLDTFNIDTEAIEGAITPRTRAVIPVHVGGLPADMNAIMDVANRRGLVVIEDAAHAHGAEYRGRRVGAIGHLGVFSFQSTKNLSCGEGGIILTSNDELAERCRSIQNCGRKTRGPWYEHHRISGNYRLSEFQGAVLNAQFERFEKQAATRESNGSYVAAGLSQMPGIVPQKRGSDCTRHAYHLFPLRFDPAVLGISREPLLKAIRAEGIPIGPGYAIPLYRQPIFKNLAFGPYTGYRSTGFNLTFTHTRCPNCELICSTQGAWMEQRLLLSTLRDLDDILRAFEKVYTNRKKLKESSSKNPGGMG